MRDYYAEEIESPSVPVKDYYAEEIDAAPAGPEPTVGITGKVPLSKYNAGERNMLGNIFDRPAAAMRSMIMGKGYTAGAVNPTNVPTFQDVGLDKFYNSPTGDRVGQMGAGAMSALARLVTGQNVPLSKEVGKIPAGMAVSAGGLAADIATNPADMLMMLAGKTPLGRGRTLGGEISKTAPAKALKAVGDYPLERIAGKAPDQVVNKAIDVGIAKGVRPSVAGKKTVAGRKQFIERSRDAVKTIVENKNALQLTDEFGNATSRLPESLDDFAQAIQQTKKNVFEQYNALQKQASGQGVKIDLKPVVNELKRVAKNKIINDNRPNVARYADDLAKRLDKRGVYTPEEAQEAIKLFNTSLEGFYKNPNFNEANRVAVEAGVVGKLRNLLDDAIEKATGREYQVLKSRYGALKSLEKDVNHRAIVYGRQNVRGLVDMLGDIAGGGDMVQGLLSLNPARFASGVAKKAIAMGIKEANKPNTLIKKMFRTVDKLHSARPINVIPEVVSEVVNQSTKPKGLPLYPNQVEGASVPKLPGNPPKPLALGMDKPTANLGVLADDFSDEAFQQVNDSIKAHVNMLQVFRRRGMKQEAAEIERNLRALLEKQGRFFKRAHELRKPVSAYEAALKRYKD